MHLLFIKFRLLKRSGNFMAKVKATAEMIESMSGTDCQWAFTCCNLDEKLGWQIPKNLSF